MVAFELSGVAPNDTVWAGAVVTHGRYGFKIVCLMTRRSSRPFACCVSQTSRTPTARIDLLFQAKGRVLSDVVASVLALPRGETSDTYKRAGFDAAPSALKAEAAVLERINMLRKVAKQKPLVLAEEQS